MHLGTTYSSTGLMMPEIRKRARAARSSLHQDLSPLLKTDWLSRKQKRHVISVLFSYRCYFLLVCVLIELSYYLFFLLCVFLIDVFLIYVVLIGFHVVLFLLFCLTVLS